MHRFGQNQDSIREALIAQQEALSILVFTALAVKAAKDPSSDFARLFDPDDLPKVIEFGKCALKLFPKEVLLEPFGAHTPGCQRVSESAQQQRRVSPEDAHACGLEQIDRANRIQSSCGSIIGKGEDFFKQMGRILRRRSSRARELRRLTSKSSVKCYQKCESLMPPACKTLFANLQQVQQTIFMTQVELVSGQKPKDVMEAHRIWASLHQGSASIHPSRNQAIEIFNQANPDWQRIVEECHGSPNGFRECMIKCSEEERSLALDMLNKSTTLPTPTPISTVSTPVPVPPPPPDTVIAEVVGPPPDSDEEIANTLAGVPPTTPTTPTPTPTTPEATMITEIPPTVPREVSAPPVPPSVFPTKDLLRVTVPRKVSAPSVPPTTLTPTPPAPTPTSPTAPPRVSTLVILGLVAAAFLFGES